MLYKPQFERSGGMVANKGFKGKKAAPFKKGGGRKQSHPRTAKGTKRRKPSGR